MLLEENGDLVIADRLNLRVRKIESATGIITTVAGNGQLFTVEEDDLITFGDGLPATEATVGTPDGLAIDSQGNLLIVDGFWDRVRRVDGLTGVITTVAGGGDPTAGLGDGGLATAAVLSEPSALALDSSDNIFIVDTFNNRIRRVGSTDGRISTVAGGGITADGLGDGGAAVNAELAFPNGLAIDGLDNLYIADTEHNRVRKVDGVTGGITTIAGTGGLIALDGEGDLAFGGGDGGPATEAAVPSPLGLAFDADGNLFISTSNNRVRRVDAQTQIITTVAGTGDSGALGDNGPALEATLSLPFGIVLDVQGNLFIADRFNNRIRAVRGPIE